MAKQTIRSKWAYWEELKDRQAQPPIVDNDLIVYQDWTKTAGSTVSNNNESDVQPLDKNYDPNVDLNPAYLSQMDMNTPIKWANQSFSEYWDDSSRDKQSTPWGENAKYTWENTKNSDVAYNPDIKTGDLNPYYVYGRTSQVYGTMHPWYISQRNDNIASALYNEWKRSKEEVEQFLSQQQWWMDSSELDRQNTIESVWKRIWDIAKKEREIPVAPDLTEDTSGKIYWKTTAEEWNPKKWIDTLADANSVLTSMQAWRTERLQEFLNLDPAVIATCLNEWVITWNEQTWRDAEQYNPEFIAEVKAEQKKQLTQKNMNAISEGWEITTATNWMSSSNTEIVNFASSAATSTTSSAQITKDIHDYMASSQTASEASETMDRLEWDMAYLKNRLKNLKSEAQAAFKWDVPDYLVKAYINNKTQEIQNQMSILEDRYNAAYNRYKTELAQTQWEKEYKLKEKELQLKQDMFDYEKTAKENGIETKKDSSETDTAATNEWDKFQVTTMSDDDVSWAVDTLLDMFDNWQLGNAQCAAGIQKYYLPMLWISLPNLSSFEQKKSLINEDADYVPKKWDLIILSSKSAPKNWHIGIVLWVLADWTIQYMDWNGSIWKDWKWTEKVAINGINPNSNSIKWYRNINKWYSNWKASWGKQWTDYDYTNFENFMKSTSASEKKALAEQYNTDLAWMTKLANEALAERDNISAWDWESDVSVTPEWTASKNADWNVVVTKQNDDWTTSTITYASWVSANDPRLKESWFDPELWFNPNAKNIYDIMLRSWEDKDTWTWIEKREKAMWRKSWQLWEEANAYQNYLNSWNSVYDYSGREASEWYDKYGFLIDAKWAYQTIAKKNWNLNDKEWTNTLKQLQLDPKDKNARSIAIREANKWQEWQKSSEADSMTQNLLGALEYIMMQDASTIQRQLIMTWETKWNSAKEEPTKYSKWYLAISPEARTWRADYNYILDTLALQELIDLKNQWATFWALSDNEWERIKSAATRINWTKDKESFREAIEDTYYELRKAIWQEISKEQIKSMWDAESSWDFTYYISKDHSTNTWPFWIWQSNVEPTKKPIWRTEYGQISNAWAWGSSNSTTNGRDIAQQQLDF